MPSKHRLLLNGNRRGTPGVIRFRLSEVDVVKAAKAWKLGFIRGAGPPHLVHVGLGSFRYLPGPFSFGAELYEKRTSPAERRTYAGLG